MVFIKPFRALHPVGSKAKEIACFPYDVANETEVRAVIEQNPSSFLRVTRPEAEFAEAVDPSSEIVLDAAKTNLLNLIDESVLVQDAEASVYVYRLATGSHSQTGIVACCSLEEYESGTIKKHEKTRPDKVADRTKHMVALRAQTGLILLAFRVTQPVSEAIGHATARDPLFEFECGSGIGHTVWRISNAADIVSAFAEVPALYIADGHHRIESALNARNILRGDNSGDTGNKDFNYVMAGIFPANELRILPYNRIVKNLGALTDEEFIARIGDNFIVTETEGNLPSHHGDICMYFRGKWFRLHFTMEYVQEPDPIERLDVTILQKYLLEPVLGIGDPRTDERIGFVGGIRGTEELERIVDNGEAEAAFALFATRMEDLFAVSDLGEIMPPKSTWFEPKLKDGLFVYEI